MAECCRGVEIRRTWCETELVRSFGGKLSPGTPDGMFEAWDGALTCVQVVRVPLIAEMDPVGMQETLARTILTKVVKSQQWLRISHVSPEDFVIFCWLPFTIPIDVAQNAEELMERVQDLDSRFSLRLRVPAEAGALFPALFAYSNPCRKPRSSTSRCQSVSESDVTCFTGTEDYIDEESEGCEWDITWDWDLDVSSAEIYEPVIEHEQHSIDMLPIISEVSACTVPLDTSNKAVWDDGG